MESIIEFLTLNYIWVIVALVFIVFTVIGYFVDRRQTKKNKLKQQAQEPIVVQNEEFTTITNENILDEAPLVESKEEAKEFFNEENFDLGNLVNNEGKSEAIVNEETPISLENDINKEYLLNQQEVQQQDVESIDDFLQRTMREAYQPTITKEDNETTEELTKEETREIDYEDTLPIPIQNEDFTPLEVTVVDPEFYKESKKETNENEFKEMEEKILDSLDKINLDNN